MNEVDGDGVGSWIRYKNAKPPAKARPLIGSPHCDPCHADVLLELANKETP
jgi:hypothetical protein